MPTVSTILLTIYAVSTSVTSASPTHDHKPIHPHYIPVPTHLTVTVFNDTSCGKDSHTVAHINPSYGIMLPTGLVTHSYTLSRALSMQEQLDWSTPYPSNIVGKGDAIPKECGTFLQTTNPDSNNHTLDKGICYAMTGGATVRGLSVRRTN